MTETLKSEFLEKPTAEYPGIPKQKWLHNSYKNIQRKFSLNLTLVRRNNGN